MFIVLHLLVCYAIRCTPCAASFFIILTTMAPDCYSDSRRDLMRECGLDCLTDLMKGWSLDCFLDYFPDLMRD